MCSRNIITCCAFCYLFVATISAQNQPDQEALTAVNETCINNDYEVLVEGNYYPDKHKIYVCRTNLPVDLTVVDVTQSPPVPVSGTFVWTINGIVSAFTTNTITIAISDFINDKVIIEPLFSGMTMTITLYNNIGLSFNEKGKNFHFDDNLIPDYIVDYNGTESVGTPWNFIETNKLDILEASVTKKKGYYAINNITSSSTSLTPTPIGLSSAQENITFTHAGMTPEIVDIHGCSNTDPELKLYVETNKVLDIQFVELCDTDDDIQVVPPGTIVNSATDVCIDGGLDDSIDGMFDPSFLKGNNVLFKDQLTGRYYVHAGVAENGEFRCRTRANPTGSPDCPSSVAISALVSAVENIFNKAGIYIVNHGVTVMNVNYNIYKEDGALTAHQIATPPGFPNDLSEQRWLHVDLYTHLAPNDGITKIFIVDNLGPSVTGSTSNVAGRATFLFYNTLAISAIHASGNEMAHEIGHAKWGLEHPGGPSYNQYNGQFGIDDYDNFMHGKASEVINWNIRRYQFPKLH